MGRPTALLLLLLLLLRAAASAPCFNIPPNSTTSLNLTNRAAACPVLDWAPFAAHRRLYLGHNGIGALQPTARAGKALEVLDMSHNELQQLPPAFLSQAQRLRDLFLQHNRLRELPASFFANATALQRLRLEGNPLAAVPVGSLPARLHLLTVACRCDVVGSVLGACRQPNCTAPACRCLSDRGEFNASEFHEQQCRHSVAVLAGAGVGAAAGLLLLLLVAAGVVLRCRGRGAAAWRWAKREPPAALAQPRYISRTAEPGVAATTATTTTTVGTGACPGPDYENIFVSPCGPPGTTPHGTPAWQRAQGSPPAPVDDEYFLESDGSLGEQPIYANTQRPGEDDVYVLPDE
uniref:Leucine-rich repeat-containing protein 25 n=1 Tax=Apteryx owenii TaxID=8824 RepID=A0A8B9QJS6_APTOW